MKAMPRRQRGVGLFDGLIALALLVIGLLAITRFQAKLIGQSTEAQMRLTAAQLADELLSTMLVDTGNARCYALPVAGDCASGAAQLRAEEWQQRAIAALPGTASATSTIDAAGNRMTVRLTWMLKAADGMRLHEVSSDIRGN